MEDQKVIDVYRGLWKIEELFKVTKSGLANPPVYVSPKEHIETHYLICFVAFVLARLLKKQLKGKYPIPVLLKSLQRCSCSLLERDSLRVRLFRRNIGRPEATHGHQFQQKVQNEGRDKENISCGQGSPGITQRFYVNTK